MKNVNEIIQAIENDGRLAKGEDGLLNASLVSLTLDYIPTVTPELKNSVIVKLTEDGKLLKPTGRATYSKIQLELVDFINSIPSQLLEVGKVKEFKLSEELLKELYQDEKFGVLFKNSYGDEIRIDAYCKNITDYKKRPNIK